MKLEEQLRRKIQTQGKSPQTAKTYWHYCEGFLRFLRKRNGHWTHPNQAGKEEVEAWLTWMANDRHGSKNSQNTALQSVAYLYREILLPDRLRVKMPRAARELRWYWLFPSPILSRDPSGLLCRHHRHPDHLSRQIKQASDRAGILTRVTSHVLRHSYATHAHEQGVPVRTLMALLGHTDIRTTEIYLHADTHAATSAHSPINSIVHNLRLYTG